MAAGQALDQQPGPGLRAKKKRRDRLIALAGRHADWALGFQDEVWFSRLALPTARAWQGQAGAGPGGPGPVRLTQRPPDRGDPEPKALSCYGLLRHDGAAAGRMHLRLVDGRPVSGVTTQFLGWLAQCLASEGRSALVLFWDNASWHISSEVRLWLRGHNRRVKSEGGCRLLACFLPSKSPWLNAIEPRWVHGKRATLEPGRKLSVAETQRRICDYYGCERLEPLAQQVA